jgi:methyl-accepting chemotaxis protein
MLEQIEKLGLKPSLYLVSGAAFLAAIAIAGLTLHHVVRVELESALELQNRSEARLVAARAAELLAGESAPAPARIRELEKLTEQARRDLDATLLVLLRNDRSALARAAKPEWAPRLNEVLAEQEKRPADSLFLWDGLYLTSTPVREGGEGTPALAFVLRGQPEARLADQVARMRNPILAVLVAAGAALLGVLWLLSQRLLVSPLNEMSALARRVSDSDLRGRAVRRSDDELGELADSLNRIVDNLGQTVQRIGGVSEAVGEVIERVGQTGASVAQGSETVSAKVAETSSSMSEMLQSIKGIANNVEVLAQSAEESSSSILEMAATNDEVAESVGQLAASVAETTAAIEEMTYSIKEVAQNVEQLRDAAKGTSASVNQMDASIGQVESNANETARLSEQAMRDAELGAEAIGRTLAGIDKIKESSRDLSATIQSLGAKIDVVGNILNVIDDVAEQTNLLALNAAILAAQSGEHGKGFAVVADEIKDLAERTGASTKEIAELIRSVELESKNAVEAIGRGVRDVEEGVRLGQEAETALKKIQASSHKSTQMVKAIAHATVEQAKGSKAVTRSIGRIAEAAQQIATATAEQARGSEQIMKSAEKMKVITKHVELSSQEQAKGSKQITRAIESISEMVNHLNRAQKDQARGSEAVLGAVRQIKEVAEAQAGSVRDLEAAFQDLARQAAVLRNEVKRFRM